MRNDVDSVNQRNLVIYDTTSKKYSDMSFEVMLQMFAAANSIGTTPVGLAFWCDALFEDCEEDGSCPPPPTIEKEENCESWSVGGSDAKAFCC